jgi:hypothetical protein
MKVTCRIGTALLVAVPLILGSANAASASGAGTPRTSAACGGQLLGNPGFETGSAAPWTESSTFNGPDGAPVTQDVNLVKTTSAGEPSHSGDHYLLIDGTGDSRIDTLTQTVTVPAGCHLSLSYWLHVDSDEHTSTAYDAFYVRANGKFEGQSTNLDQAPGYFLKTVDLSEFAGQDVTLSFSGTEDSGIQTSFVLDDVALTLS